MVLGSSPVISLAFITQSYFSVPKEVRSNSTHSLFMKIHNKKELPNIATDHSSDIDYNDFMEIYRKCRSELCYFLTIDTTLPADNLLKCRKYSHKNDIKWTT